ncbi:hypothetical protein PV772_19715 [Pseudarthrobacter sp. CC12]|uniref:hypothetical protein n=1 Tax=Pseudarthrobacter sp. CC12 TaxID=3029193 RepID=UPI0032635DF7
MTDPVPLLIVDHDDPDLCAIKAIASVDVIELGWPNSDYEFSWELGHDWLLRTPTGDLTPASLAKAATVFYRRWRSSPPAPVVQADKGAPLAEALFVERQWEDTLAPILAREHDKASERWSLSPLHRDLKIETLMLLGDMGLAPRTKIGLSAPAYGDWIWKPIHVDQSVGEQRAAAILVPAADRGIRQPCPGFYQEKIDVALELRVGYSFGIVGLTSQIPLVDTDLVDKRYVDTSRKPVQNLIIENQCRDVARALDLNVFTADVLCDQEGRWWWCDINPDGLFSAADSKDGHLVERLVSGLTQHADSNQ